MRSALLRPRHYIWLLVVVLFTTVLAPAALAGWDPLFRSYEIYAEGQPGNNLHRGGEPARVAVGDFNGDGLPDVVATNLADSVSNGGNTVSVLTHTGDPDYPQMFNTWEDFSIGQSPAGLPLGLAVADMNQDGKPDIVTCNQGGGGSVSILLGTGTGFRAARVFPVSNAVAPMAVGDLNGDGLPDVVVTSNNATGFVQFKVMLAATGDSLGSAVLYTGAAGNGSGDMVIADATGDGVRDILLFGTAGLYIYRGNNTGAFGTFIGPLSIGANPGAISVALLNGDAIPDVCVVCADGTVWAYMGLGGGSFQAPVVISDGVTSASSRLNILPGDVDGDGDLDLVLVSSSFQEVGNVTVLRNNGAGSFAAAVHYAGLYGAGGSCLADINQDGRLDVVGPEALDTGNTVGILLNDGTGGFLSQTRAMGATFAIREAVGDFNRDGIPDVAASDSAGVRIGLGNGDGTFAPGSFINTPSDPGNIATGDVNRDGKVDLLVQVGSVIDVLLGVGDGTFALSQVVSASIFPRSIIDMDRDGRLDIVGSDPTRLAVYIQQSNQLFTLGPGTPKTPTVGLTAICTGDWNRDGVPDVAVAGPNGLSTYAGSAISPGTLGGETVVITGKSYVDVCAADFNGDGVTDLAARESQAGTNLGSGIDVYFGTGIGTFAATATFGVLERWGLSMDTWDANRDGIPDLITSGLSQLIGSPLTSVDVLLGNGKGKFGLRSSYGLGSLDVKNTFQSARFTGADVNRDGAPDLLAGVVGFDAANLFPGFHSVRTSLASPPSRGNGYQPSAFYATVSGPNQVAVGDLNRDGKLDAVTASINTTPGVAVHLGTGNGVLGSATLLAQSWAAFRVGLADLNRDGILDIVTSNYGVGAPRVSSMLGVGDGTFGARNDLFINASLDFEIGDMNRDGIPDVVTATQDSVRVLLGTGTGTFTPASAVALTPIYDLDLADLDGDGVLDVICARGNKVTVLFSHGDGSLGSPINLIVPVTNCTTVCIGDLNRDGWPDIVAEDAGTYYAVWGGNGAGYFTYGLTNLGYSAFDLKVGEAQANGEPFLYVAHNLDKVEVLRWNPLGSFQSVGSYTITNQPESIALGDMDHDGVADILSVSSAGSSVSVTLHGSSGITGVATPPPAAPRAALHQNYPNPFNPTTTIRFTLAARDRVRLAIFDVQGRLVDEVVNRDLPAGDHAIQWRGVNRMGQSVASGVYYYRLVTDSGYTESKRMAVVK